jgi:hypothetical protein
MAFLNLSLDDGVVDRQIAVAGCGYDGCKLHLVQASVSSHSEVGGVCLHRGIALVDMGHASCVERYGEAHAPNVRQYEKAVVREASCWWPFKASFGVEEEDILDRSAIGGTIIQVY